MPGPPTGQTPYLQLPYPIADDTVDVPRDMQALATTLDGLMRAPAVTALPATAKDGDELFFVADAANGIVWHLRYRTAAGAPYRWEFVGGGWLYSTHAGPMTTSTNTPTISTAGITPPVRGQYRTGFGARATVNGGSAGVLNTMTLGLYVGGQYVDQVNAVETAVSSGPGLWQEIPIYVNAAGAKVDLRYSSDQSMASTFHDLKLALQPIRVG
jgi:hypothetical protein